MKSKYFSQKDKKSPVIFTGNELVAYIPQRYSLHQLLTASSAITTLMIFDYEVDGEELTMFMPTVGTMHPSSIESVTVNGVKFVKATLRKGDIMMESTEVVKNARILYVIFYEMMMNGKLPKGIKFDDSPFIFQKAQELNGFDLHTDIVIFEAMCAFTWRTVNDLSVQGRFKPKAKLINIPMRASAHLATSVSSKIIGAYMEDGLTDAMVHASEYNTEIEDLLRS